MHKYYRTVSCFCFCIHDPVVLVVVCLTVVLVEVSLQNMIVTSISNSKIVKLNISFVTLRQKQLL